MTPVFLLGPGRSGTTLLYKLIAAMPGVAYISNYNARFPNVPALAWLGRPFNTAFGVKRYAWFQDEGGAYFNRGRAWYRRWVPTPQEGESVYRACGVPPPDGQAASLSFADVARLRARFGEIATAFGSPVLVSKRTSNNLRVAQLLQAFPEARFVCLLRDGRAVARSLVRVSWWPDDPLFWSGRTPRSLVAEGEDDLTLAARNWVEEMAALERGMCLIPAGHRLDVHYDDLLAAPRNTLQRVHDFLVAGRALPAAYWSFIDSLGLRPTPPGWLARWNREERERVEAVQGETLRRWGFVDPAGGLSRSALPAASASDPASSKPLTQRSMPTA